jgi:hypothetical protein
VKWRVRFGRGRYFEKHAAGRRPSWSLALPGSIQLAVASAAALAGLIKGDIITTANNIRIRSPSQFRNIVGLTPVGSEIDLRVRRGKEIVTAKVQIEALKQKRSDQHARRN